MLVVDASVAVKWFVPEPGEEAAQKLLTSGEPLIAPSIIRLEVTGAFVRRFRNGDLREDKARAACDNWEQTLAEGTVHLFSDDQLLEEAVQCAFAIKHFVPDCLYVVLGKRHDATIITADGPMVERGQRVYDKISLLEGSNPN